MSANHRNKPKTVIKIRGSDTKEPDQLSFFIFCPFWAGFCMVKFHI